MTMPLIFPEADHTERGARLAAAWQRPAGGVPRRRRRPARTVAGR
ncbi:MAG TPA: hypothetical protein VK038_09555 [Ornithinicoccus sp.]|jgi:hypothetical protein|nr:hypothetical protein [Ornithinicoccus sp.]